MNGGGATDIDSPVEKSYARSVIEEELGSWVIGETGARGVDRVERIQSLWSGYGDLVRIHLVGATVDTVIVKWAKPPASDAQTSDVSHARKCRSYDVEAAFYRGYAKACSAACRVPALIGQRVSERQWVLLLEDLDHAGFSKRCRDPKSRDLDACLSWLASFHARFLGAKPDGLWSTGTYWHLATRRNELARIRDPDLLSRASELDQALAEAKFRTFVHGDAKPANFCFASDGSRVAAVDFQYVGGGPGIKDVAYLLHGSTSRAEEARALSTYFAYLSSEVDSTVDAARLEREWRELYSVAVDDFRRFLAVWRG